MIFPPSVVVPSTVILEETHAVTLADATVTFSDPSVFVAEIVIQFASFALAVTTPFSTETAAALDDSHTMPEISFAGLPSSTHLTVRVSPIGRLLPSSESGFPSASTIIPLTLSVGAPPSGVWVSSAITSSPPSANGCTPSSFPSGSSVSPNISRFSCFPSGSLPVFSVTLSIAASLASKEKSGIPHIMQHTRTQANIRFAASLYIVIAPFPSLSFRLSAIKYPMLIQYLIYYID